MEIILRDHVEHLGSRGQIVKVADGYARNYLLPRKLALEATEANRHWIARERKIAEAREGEGIRRRQAQDPAPRCHQGARRVHRAGQAAPRRDGAAQGDGGERIAARG